MAGFSGHGHLDSDAAPADDEPAGIGALPAIVGLWIATCCRSYATPTKAFGRSCTHGDAARGMG
jgi:hypothetical protein